jgi:hypothetical protein
MSNDLSQAAKLGFNCSEHGEQELNGLSQDSNREFYLVTLACACVFKICHEVRSEDFMLPLFVINIKEKMKSKSQPSVGLSTSPK